MIYRNSYGETLQLFRLIMLQNKQDLEGKRGNYLVDVLTNIWYAFPQIKEMHYV
jgi:hypothetical protein